MHFKPELTINKVFLGEKGAIYVYRLCSYRARFHAVIAWFKVVIGHYWGDYHYFRGLAVNKSYLNQYIFQFLSVAN